MRELEEELESTEITLGTGKLLGLFLGLVVICAIFFSLGYALGKNSTPVQAQMTEPPATLAPGTTPAAKPGAGTSAPAASYATTDQSYSTPETIASDTASGDTGASDTMTGNTRASAVEPVTRTPETRQQAAPKPVTVSATAHATGIIVQVAAVRRLEDAEILISALRKKNYPVFLANNGAGPDNLFHVQIGPFTALKDAESVKERLADDGYSPIVKH
jgi:cell division septation protein DedD